MLKSILSASLFISLAACNTKSKGIEILGQLTGTNLSKVYFVNAYDWQTLIDSANIQDGRFRFLIDVAKIKSPFLASICYKDNTGQLKKFEFKNHILSPYEAKFIEDAFFMDTSHIEMSADFTQSQYLNIIAGLDTRAYFETQMIDFGFLDNTKPDKESRYRRFKEIISKYPKSTYLFGAIFQNRSLYSKDELFELINCFDKSLQQTDLALKLRHYAQEKPAENKVLTNFFLAKEDNSLTKMYDTTAKLTMLIVWASWCGPCRMEIPDLKSIRDAYADKELAMTSVSIDENNADWHKALLEEKMNWRQLFVNADTQERFHKDLDFNSIPLTIFIDKKGRELKRFVGFDKSRKDSYNYFIRSFFF